MKKTNRFIGASFAVFASLAVANSAHAAYPTEMELTVEFWNDTANDLQLNSASWFAPGTDLSPYTLSADDKNYTFKLTLKDPRDDAAHFSVRSGDKLCAFTMSHKKTFSWISINLAPEKFATARSMGATPAECSAAIIKGGNSLAAYTARLRIK